MSARLVGTREDQLDARKVARIRSGPHRCVDFVVGHVDPLAEIDSYWAQVYGSPAEGFGQAYMERHERFGRGAIKPPPIAQLRAALGAPRYEDGTLIVWAIRSE